jgi:hypothetical protein
VTAAGLGTGVADGDERLDAMWGEFVTAYRQRRAPAALRDRVIAALRAAAADGEPDRGGGLRKESP